MMKEFVLKDIYAMTSLVERSVDYGEGFWNFDEDYFIHASTGFSKDTLLHQYIVCSLYNIHHREFRKDGDLFDCDNANYWVGLFSNYGICVTPPNFDQDEDDAALNWIESESEVFLKLFDKMGQEVFHLLFSNRGFLLKFNVLASRTVKELKYPNNAITKKGTIRRCRIPTWAKNAVYHRDKGRCVFCNTDLTGLINILTGKNFDHMIPLDRFGTNDPCNLQLACERCNKSKSNRNISTSHIYQSWW